MPIFCVLFCSHRINFYDQNGTTLWFGSIVFPRWFELLLRPRLRIHWNPLNASKLIFSNLTFFKITEYGGKMSLQSKVLRFDAYITLFYHQLHIFSIHASFYFLNFFFQNKEIFFQLHLDSLDELNTITRAWIYRFNYSLTQARETF